MTDAAPRVPCPDCGGSGRIGVRTPNPTGTLRWCERCIGMGSVPVTDPAETEAGTWHVEGDSDLCIVGPGGESFAMSEVDGIEAIVTRLGEYHALAAKVPALEAALEDCVKRMYRARSILGGGAHAGNWGMLDTTAARVALDDLHSAEVGR